MQSFSSVRAVLIAVALLAGCGLGAALAADQPSGPIKLVVDASLAASQSVVKTHEEIPVSP
ncbi:MAG TPA: hypothetical protein VMS32_01335, partial [Verrucomicrobiae bacterium]|nr:hypothetical protein [Verrucomicrobiae bacterium]